MPTIAKYESDWAKNGWFGSQKQKVECSDKDIKITTFSKNVFGMVKETTQTINTEGLSKEQLHKTEQELERLYANNAGVISVLSMYMQLIELSSPSAQTAQKADQSAQGTLPKPPPVLDLREGSSQRQGVSASPPPLLKTVESTQPVMTPESSSAENILPSLLTSFIAAADRGDPEAQYVLSRMYNSGEEVERNPEKAIYYLRKAVAQGYPDAQYKLGFMHAVGEGVEQDYDSAAKYYLLAADQGHEIAQMAYSFLCFDGLCSERDLTKARQFIQKAADEDNSVAQTMLGTIHEKENHNMKAFEYYEKAANQEDPDGMYHLGTMYEKGPAFEKEAGSKIEKALLKFVDFLLPMQDSKKAFALYLKAAEKNHVEALFALGRMYEQGIGTEKNIDKAFECYQQAASQGNEEAQKKIREFGGTII